MLSKDRLRAVDFFCGGGGMTYGLRESGIDVVAGIDCNKNALETYELNNPGSKFICSNIEVLPLTYLEKELHIKKQDDNMLFVGCSPCQFYSIINTDRTKSKATKDLLKNFLVFIEYYMPGFVLVENVPGIVTNKDTILHDFIGSLNRIGYDNYKYEILDLSYYGVPQTRKRFSLIATRLDDIQIKFPQKDEKQSILKDYIGTAHGFPAINAGNIDCSDFCHSTRALSDKNLKRLQKTRKNGGSRFDWADDPELQLKCFKNRGGSFKDTFGRMCWEKPSPTITTKFISISNGRFAHPDEDRAISIREGATLQTFPKNYVFKADGLTAKALLIGNAVPCEFARRLGESIRKMMNER